MDYGASSWSTVGMRRQEIVNHEPTCLGLLPEQHVPHVGDGREFGGRDHSTVVYAVRSVRQRMTKDEETRLLVSRLEGLVNRSKKIVH